MELGDDCYGLALGLVRAESDLRKALECWGFAEVLGYAVAWELLIRAAECMLLLIIN